MKYYYLKDCPSKCMPWLIKFLIWTYIAQFPIYLGCVRRVYTLVLRYFFGGKDHAACTSNWKACHKYLYFFEGYAINIRFNSEFSFLEAVRIT